MFKQFSTQAIIDSALRAVFYRPPKEFYEPPETPRPSNRLRYTQRDLSGKHARFLAAYRANPLNYLPTVVVNSCMRRNSQQSAEVMGYSILCSMAREKLVAIPTQEMQAKYGKYTAERAA